MNCAFHPAYPATAFCQGCGRGLCHACTNRFNIVKCPLCAKAHNASLARSATFQLVLSAAIYVGCFILTGAMKDPKTAHVLPLGTRLLGTYTWGSIFWGWQFLKPRGTRLVIFNPMFLFFYFAAKLMIAGFVGVFVAPWQIIKCIRSL